MSNDTSDEDCADKSAYENTYLGIFYLCHTIFYYPFYIPTAIVLFKKKNIEISCYKFMAALAIDDMCGLIGNGLFPAIWSIMGTSYCEHYWFMKIVGAFTNGTWISYAYLCMSLSINRAAEFSDSVWSVRLFDGQKTYYWIAGSFACGLIYMTAYCTPNATLIYHAGIGVLLFDPKNPDKLGAWMNMFTDCLTPAVLIICYLIVVKEMRSMANKITDDKSRARINAINNKRKVTLTSVIICILAGTTALSYPILQGIGPKDTWPLTASHICWQMTNGTNCLIYLLLNPSIRKDVKSLIGISPGNVTTVVSVRSRRSPTKKTQGESAV